jgi:hypothetical protein
MKNKLQSLALGTDAVARKNTTGSFRHAGAAQRKAVWRSVVRGPLLSALMLALSPLFALPAQADLLNWQGDILVAYPNEWANTVWGEPGNWDLGRVPTRADSALIQGGKTVLVTSGVMPWGTFVNNGTVGSINMIGDGTGVPTLTIASFSTLDVSAGYISSLTLYGLLTGGDTFGPLSIGQLNWQSGCCATWDPYRGGYVPGGMGGLGTTTVENNLGGGNLYGSRVLNLAGTATSGDFTLYDNARVVNSGYMTSPGGAVNNGGNWGGGGAYNPNRRFDNTGTLVFEPGAGGHPGSSRQEFTTFFNNSGTVDVRQGTATVARLQVLAGGTHSGHFNAQAGTELDFEKTNTFTAGSSINSAGKVVFQNGSSTMGGSYNAAITEVSNADVTFAGSVGPMGDLTLNSYARLTFNTGAPVGMGTVVLNGGGVGGTDTINIAGLLTWNSGYVNGSPVNANGGIQVNAGARHDIYGTLNNPGTSNWDGGSYDVYGTFNNAGTVNWNAGDFRPSGYLHATINNLAGAVFDAKANNQIKDPSGTGGASFNNLGTFRKSGGGGDTLIEGAFNNSGTVDVQTGTLLLNGGGTHSGGSFTAQPGAYILVQGTHTITGNVTTAGQFGPRFIGGGYTSALVVDAGATFTHLSGSWSGTDITNRGVFDNHGEFYTPNFDNRGTAFNRLGASLYLNGNNSGSFDNAGTVVMGDFTNAAGGTLNNIGTISASGNFDNQGGFANSGTLTNYAMMNAGNITGPGGIVNGGGEFTIAAGNAVTGAGSYTQLGGLTRVNGLLQAGAIDIQYGILQGTGTVSGPVTVGAYGQILPGNSPGLLHIDGNLDVNGMNTWGELGPSLVIQIASPTSFGQLAVSGNVSFATGGKYANVLFDFLSGNVPDMDDQFQWLTAGGTVSGEGFLAPTVGPPGWNALVVRNGAGLSASFEKTGAYQITTATWPYHSNTGALVVAAADHAYNLLGAPGSGLTYFVNFGSVDNQGQFYNRVGAFFWNEYTGTLTNQAGAYMQNRGAMNNGGAVDNYGTFVNRSDGTLSNYGTLTNRAGGQMTNQGVIVNQAYATISNAGTFEVSGSVRNDGEIVNGGTFNVPLGGLVTGSGTYLQTGGMTRVNGDLSASSMHFAAGEIRGDGTLNGTLLPGPIWSVVIDTGVVVHPGNSPGTLTINGNVMFNGNLEIEIASASEFDHLVINGDIAFGGGQVNYLLLNGYTPDPGTTFGWFTAYGAVTNPESLNFATFVVNADGSYTGWIPPAGTQGQTRFIGGQFVFDIAPVPEPETWAMMLAGLGLVGFSARRRRAAQGARRARHDSGLMCDFSARRMG